MFESILVAKFSDMSVLVEKKTPSKFLIRYDLFTSLLTPFFIPKLIFGTLCLVLTVNNIC